MLRKASLVAQREYLENIRTKTFWLGILSFPVLLLAAILVPMLFERAREARTFAVLDHSGWLLAEIEPQLTAARDRFALQPVAAGTTEEALAAKVGSGELFAYFVLPADPVAGQEPGRYASKNLTDGDLRGWFSGLASEVVRAKRLADKQIAPEVAAWVAAPLALEARKISKTGEAEEVDGTDMLRQWAPAALVYLLWIAVFSIAQMLLTNTVEEKSNRIMEVLLSSISPLELMMGKIVGIAATGLTMVGSWVLFFLGTSVALPRMLGFQMPFDLTVVAGDPLLLGSFLIYFVLGYLLYASILVALGSVCNTLKEAQNLMSPIMLLLMVPLMALVPVGRDPNGLLAKVLSFVPPFTPFVMMNRAAGPPSVFEYFATTVLLIVTITVTMWGAAKIFRVGILMTGKPPRLGEILRWLRAPVGQVPVTEGTEPRGG